jgi:hypothetical protein
MTEDAVWIEAGNAKALRQREEIAKAQARVAVLESALHHISLSSQNSMSSKEEGGRIARAALASDGSPVLDALRLAREALQPFKEPPNRNETWFDFRGRALAAIELVLP